MLQGSNLPRPHLLAALQHHHIAQELTGGLFDVLQVHDSKERADPALAQLLVPLQTVLNFPSTPEESIRRLKEALDAGSTPRNILKHLEHSSLKDPDLEQALLRYDELLRKAGDLDRLLHVHRLALDLAVSPDYGFTVDPGMRFGKPCLNGQRLCVYDVLEYLASGMTPAEVIHDFPDLTPEDLQKCQAFAKELCTGMDTPAPD